MDSLDLSVDDLRSTSHLFIGGSIDTLLDAFSPPTTNKLTELMNATLISKMYCDVREKAPS